jgi:hypothetical protein
VSARAVEQQDAADELRAFRWRFSQVMDGVGQTIGMVDRRNG